MANKALCYRIDIGVGADRLSIIATLLSIATISGRRSGHSCAVENRQQVRRSGSELVHKLIKCRFLFPMLEYPWLLYHFGQLRQEEGGEGRV